jgi:hypothetical protein
MAETIISFISSLITCTCVLRRGNPTFLSHSLDMTRYRIFRPRNPVQQQHGQAEEKVPGLQLVRSEDSSVSTFPGELIPAKNDCYPQARVLQSSKWTNLDVHSCKSILCDSCRRPRGTTFLTVPVVPASTIRCLPCRWWEKNYDETKANTLLSAAIAEYKERFPVGGGEEVDAPYDEAMYSYRAT